MEKAIIAEQGSETLSLYNKEKKNRSKAEGSLRVEGNRGNRGEKRKGNYYENVQVKQESVRKQIVQCKNCEKNHSGECRKGKFVCYKCGQEGHISPNCPNPRMNSGYFICGSIEHQVRNCPKRRMEAWNVTAGKGSETLAIKGPTSSNNPTVRVFNMTVEDTVAAGNGTPGTIQIIYIFYMIFLYI